MSRAPGFSPAKLSLSEVKEQFAREMRAHGVPSIDEIVADGRLHRYRVEGDKAGKRNGWYVLHADGVPAGMFGSFPMTGKRI